MHMTGCVIFDEDLAIKKANLLRLAFLFLLRIKIHKLKIERSCDLGMSIVPCRCHEP